MAPGEMSCFSCSFGVSKTPEKARYLDAHLCRCLDIFCLYLEPLRIETGRQKSVGTPNWRMMRAK